MLVLFQVTTETYGLKFSGYWQSMGRKCSLPSYKIETRLILANMKLASLLLGILRGCVPPVLKILTLYQTKNVICQTRLQTWPRAKKQCHHYLD